MKSNENNSPEYHHNLAVGFAKKPDYVNTSLELAESIKLFSSPFSRIKEVENLRDVQRTLGIQHSSLEKSYSVGLLAVSKEMFACMGMITFWTISLYYYFQFSKRRYYKILPVLGFTTLIGMVTILGLIKTFGTLGVLSAAQDVPVYSSSEMKEKIVSLPPGTVVRVRKTRQESHQILDPIYGWIKTSECQLTGLPALADFPS